MDFTDPHFAAPAGLLALIPVALLFAALRLYAARKRRRAIAAIASKSMVDSLLAGHSPARRLVKDLLTGVAVALLVASLARPCWGVIVGQTADDAEDVMFLLDTSRSMTANDVPPNRLDRAKRAIATFVGMHPSGRLGLVAFAGDAFLQCPPTSDRDIFSETLDEMGTDVIPRPGTDVGGALEAGYTAFGEKKEGVKHTMVLLTDGEDLDGRGVEIAKKLGREGVVIHTVGIGGAGIAIPAHADGSGGTVMTSLDEKTLREIASATNGEYFRLDGKSSGFSAVEARLGRIASNAGGGARTPVERFLFPLSLAALMLAIEPLIGTRRQKTGLRSATVAKAAALLALFALLPSGVRAETPEKLYDMGTEAIGAGSYVEAEGLFKNALENADESLRPTVLHNMGQARARSGAKVFDKHVADVAKNNPADIVKSLSDALAPVNRSLEESEVGIMDKNAAAQAYGQGRAVRKDALKKLRSARDNIAEGEEAVRRLERGRDDFLGARELAPEDKAAKENADAIDEYLKKAKAKLEEEKKAADQASKKADELKKKLKKLRQKLTGESGEGEGADDDDEDGKDPKKGSAKDQRSEAERKSQEGAEGRMSREESLSQLEGMRPGLRGRISPNFNRKSDESKPRDPSNDR